MPAGNPSSRSNVRHRHHAGQHRDDLDLRTRGPTLVWRRPTPSTNYGTSTKLRNDGGSDTDVESYLAFAVSGTPGSVQSAKLRLHAYSGTADGPAVYATRRLSWVESGPAGITWATRPPPASTARDDKAAIAASSWVEFDVTPFVGGNGTYGFSLATTSSDGIDFRSRESSSLRPELVLTTG